MSNTAAELARILGVATSAFEEIRNDPTLSADGKHQKLAAVSLKASEAAAAVRQAEAGALADDLGTMRRQVFRPERDLTGFHRDALAAADATTSPQELTALIQKGVRRGDDSLVRAAGEVAFERATSSHPLVAGAWIGVLREFQSNRSAQDSARVDALFTASTPDANRDVFNALGQGFADSALVPGELSGLDRRRLERMAAGELGFRGLPLGVGQGNERTSSGVPVSRVPRYAGSAERAQAHAQRQAVALNDSEALAAIVAGEPDDMAQGQA